VLDGVGTGNKGRTELVVLIDRVCLLVPSFRRHCGIDARAGATIQLVVADFMRRPVVPVFMMSV
jgi:hypothetical protein